MCRFPNWNFNLRVHRVHHFYYLHRARYGLTKAESSASDASACWRGFWSPQPITVDNAGPANQRLPNWKPTPPKLLQPAFPPYLEAEKRMVRSDAGRPGRVRAGTPFTVVSLHLPAEARVVGETDERLEWD